MGVRLEKDVGVDIVGHRMGTAIAAKQGTRRFTPLCNKIFFVAPKVGYFLRSVWCSIRHLEGCKE